MLKISVELPAGMLMEVFLMSLLCARILQKPELAREIDLAALGKLLPEQLLNPLEEQYLEKQQVAQAYSSPRSLVSWYIIILQDLVFKNTLFCTEKYISFCNVSNIWPLIP